jgi:hypothetical protein
LIGHRLVHKLLDRGDRPVVITRRFSVARQALGPNVELVEGDPMQPGPWMDKITDCDAVIHLAGENIFGRRWNTAFKQLLVDSRVKSTQNIAQALSRKPNRGNGEPKVLVNASAIGIYGPRGDEEITEETAPASDFLGNLCVEWEKAARAVESAGVRSVQVRVGVVLDREGGALAQLVTPFKLGGGGPVGSGKQYMAWIHHEDMVNLFLFALDTPTCTGPMNGTAPSAVTNKVFSKALGKAMHRPSFMWTPGVMLRLLLGEAATIVTSGQRVVPRKALALGFVFQYPTIDQALGQLFA